MFNFKVSDPFFLPHCGCDVDLSVAPGSALIISGENGLGKSSLISRWVYDSPHKIGMVEQLGMDFFYNRNLKKLKQIFLYSSKDKIDKFFFQHCWEQFGMDKKEDRYQASLSGGEGQALKICLGLAIDAPIYILDEPSQYLDEGTKKVLNRCLESLLDRKKSIVLIEHDFAWIQFRTQLVQLEMSHNVLKVGKTWTT